MNEVNLINFKTLLLSTVIVSATFLAPINSIAQKSQTKEKANTKDNIIFFEDFSGKEIDRTKWNVVITGKTVNEEQQAYVDSSATLYLVKGAEAEGAENGALVIHPRYSPGYTTPEGKKFDFISGRIDSKSKVEFTYGTASARMKLPEGSGLWPAFWILGDGKWPETGEIDVMENVGEADWTSVALHGPGYSGETPLVNKVFLKSGNGADQWHVYSVDWTPEKLIFKVDGEIIYRATKPMVVHFGPWAFDNPKYLIVNLALGGAYPVKTNGVKVPYNGIPESTLKLIKDNKGKVLVDWVKVTKIEGAEK